eukprot:UC4_evm1s551
MVGYGFDKITGNLIPNAFSEMPGIRAVIEESQISITMRGLVTMVIHRAARDSSVIASYLYDVTAPMSFSPLGSVSNISTLPSGILKSYLDNITCIHHKQEGRCAIDIRANGKPWYCRSTALPRYIKIKFTDESDKRASLAKNMFRFAAGRGIAYYNKASLCAEGNTMELQKSFQGPFPNKQKEMFNN